MLQHNEFWKFVSQNDLHFSIGALCGRHGQFLPDTHFSVLYSNRFFGWAPGFPTNNCFCVFFFFFPQFPLRADVMRVISGSGLLAEYGCNGRSWSNCFGP